MNQRKSALLLWMLAGLTMAVAAVLVIWGESPWQIVIIVPAVYSLFYLLAYLFSVGCKAPELASKNTTKDAELVAVLMTVCDDFDELAVESLTKLTFPSYHLFILDDSKSEIERARVAIWCKQYEDVCTRITRTRTSGFKAGNLNDADHSIPEKYQLLCVVDSDQEVGPTFLNELYDAFCAAGRPAFLQAVHRGRTHQVSSFARCLAPTIYAEWRYLLPYKNTMGLPTIFGHGYLIDRAVLREVGGHPEIVSEDLALTMVLHAKGHRGLMAPNIVSEEVFPSSFRAIQTRRFRWVTADWQILFSQFFRKFLAARDSSVEILDLILREIRLPLSSIYFGILLGFACTHLALWNWNDTNGMLQTSGVKGGMLTIGPLFLAATPLFPLLFHGSGRFFERIRAGFAAVFLALSMVSLQVAAGICFSVNRTALFETTNQRCYSGEEKPYIRWSGVSGVLAWSMDVGISLLFITYGILSGDLAVILIGACSVIRRCIVYLSDGQLQGQVWILGVIASGVILYQLLFLGTISIVGFGLICGLPFLVV